jgi:putative endonuclease
MDHNYYVYIVSDNTRSTLYIGVTNDLERRIYEHRNPDKASFTQQYHCVHLVYYEQFPDVHAALAREKQLKGWTRKKKDALIATMNPHLEDLAANWY